MSNVDEPIKLPRAATLDVRQVDAALRVTLTGDWLVSAELPSTQQVGRALTRTPGPSSVGFDTTALGRWDSGLVTRLIDVYRDAEAQAIVFDDRGLPDGARRLIALAFAVKAREGAERKQRKTSFVQQVGEGAQELR